VICLVIIRQYLINPMIVVKLGIENDYGDKELNSEEIIKYITNKYNCRSVPHLNFLNYVFNRKIIDLPKCVKLLFLRNDFNNVMNIDILDNIKEIHFSKYFKRKISELPRNIEKININCCVDESYTLVIPKTMKTIIIRCPDNIDNKNIFKISCDPCHCPKLEIDLRLIKKIKDIFPNYELIKRHVGYYVSNKKIYAMFDRHGKIKDVRILSVDNLESRDKSLISKTEIITIDKSLFYKNKMNKLLSKKYFKCKTMFFSCCFVGIKNIEQTQNFIHNIPNIMEYIHTSPYLYKFHCKISYLPNSVTIYYGGIMCDVTDFNNKLTKLNISCGTNKCKEHVLKKLPFKLKMLTVTGFTMRINKIPENVKNISFCVNKHFSKTKFPLHISKLNIKNDGMKIKKYTKEENNADINSVYKNVFNSTIKMLFLERMPFIPKNINEKIIIMAIDSDNPYNVFRRNVKKNKNHDKIIKIYRKLRDSVI
jgi:hypothetical protein